MDGFISGPKGAELSRAAACEPLTGLAVLCSSSTSKQAAPCSVLWIQNFKSNAPNHHLQLVESCMSFLKKKKKIHNPGHAHPSSGTVGLVSAASPVQRPPPCGRVVHAFDPLCCLLRVSVETPEMEK